MDYFQACHSNARDSLSNAKTAFFLPFPIRISSGRKASVNSVNALVKSNLPTDDFLSSMFSEMKE